MECVELFRSFKTYFKFIALLKLLVLYYPTTEQRNQLSPRRKATDSFKQKKCQPSAV